MSTKLTELKEDLRKKSFDALAIAENRDKKYASFADQKSALDPIEADIKKLEEAIADEDYMETRRKAFAQSAGTPPGDAGGSDDKSTKGKSLGAQFVGSDGYKSLVEKGLKGNFHSGDIELKAPLFEGSSNTPGDGYSAAVPAPTVLPGIVDIKLRPLTIADLFPSGTTNSPLIRYLVETMVTNGADAVLEGDLKPESGLKFDKVDEVLHKIATFLPISDEMLEDWAQALSYIDARLLLFVKLAEEAQLLNGDGTGANLVGILNRSGLATPIAKGSAPSVGSDTSMDAIYRQITVIRTTQFLEPDAIAIDPLGWQNIVLSKNSQGAYYAGGPFVDQANLALWGKRVAVSPAMGSQQALVGAYQQGGQIFRKGGLTVAASNSHADYFQRNLTALRAEERVALAIYRPGAFGLVTGLS